MYRGKNEKIKFLWILETKTENEIKYHTFFVDFVCIVCVKEVGRREKRRKMHYFRILEIKTKNEIYSLTPYDSVVRIVCVKYVKREKKE